MAQEIEVTLIVQTEDAVAQLEKFAEELNKTEKKVTRAAKKSTKGYQELGDVFSRLLPRSMQGLIRNFKQTKRSIDRASKSVKLFSKAWIATGFGALVVVLGEIIANWDSIAEAVGFTNAELEQTARLQSEINTEIDSFNTTTRPYVAILKDTNSSLNQRVTATDELVKLMPELNGYELDSAEGMERINIALKENERLIDIRIAKRQLEGKLEEAASKARDGELTFWENLKITLADQTLFGKRGANLEAQRQKNRTEGQEEYNLLMEEYLELIGDSAEIEGKRADTARIQREADEKAREDLRIQTARLKITQEQTRALEILNIEKSDGAAIDLQVAEQMLLYQQEDQLTAMTLQGATDEQLEIQRKLHVVAMKKLYDDWLAGELKDYEAYATALEEEVNRSNQAIEDSRAKLLSGEGKDGMTNEETEIQATIDKYNKQIDLEKLFSEEYYEVIDARERELARITAKYSAERVQTKKEENEDLFNAALDFTLGVADMYGTLSDMQEEDEEKKKQYAVTEIALNTAVALANAIAGAAKAAASTTAGAPFVLGGYIVSMFATIMNAQKSISSIMNSVGAGGGDDVSIPQPVVPNVSDDFMLNEFTGQGERSFRAYVVESDIQGAISNATLVDSRASLGG
tara:strand:+ start:6884 stop:8791 length:1908 start_codon:yes stop_codon:yes gene_type:complete